MKLAHEMASLVLSLAACSAFQAADSGTSGAAPSDDAGSNSTDAGDAATAPAADARPPAPAEGLIGYWKFDEGSGAIAQDSSGHQNDALITNGVWAPGKYGTAMKSTGPDRVRVAALDGAHFPQTGTLAFWLNAASFEGLWVFDVYDNKSLVYVTVNPKDENGPARIEVLMTKREPLKSGPTTEFVSSLPIAVNEWHHVAVVWDTAAHHGYAYFDAKLTLDKPLPTDWAPSDETFQFFAPGCCDDALRGLVDDVRLYDRALSATEIPSLP